MIKSENFSLVNTKTLRYKYDEANELLAMMREFGYPSEPLEEWRAECLRELRARGEIL